MSADVTTVRPEGAERRTVAPGGRAWRARLSRSIPIVVLLLLCSLIGAVDPVFLTTGNLVRWCCRPR